MEEEKIITHFKKGNRNCCGNYNYYASWGFDGGEIIGILGLCACGIGGINVSKEHTATTTL